MVDRTVVLDVESSIRSASATLLCELTHHDGPLDKRKSIQRWAYSGLVADAVGRGIITRKDLTDRERRIYGETPKPIFKEFSARRLEGSLEATHHARWHIERRLGREIPWCFEGKPTHGGIFERAALERNPRSAIEGSGPNNFARNEFVRTIPVMHFFAAYARLIEVSQLINGPVSTLMDLLHDPCRLSKLIEAAASYQEAIREEWPGPTSNWGQITFICR